MDYTKVHGTHGEGRILCPSCAERIFGNSLDMYVNSGDFQILSDQDLLAYSSKGLLCDECFDWIFLPDPSEDTWWLMEPDPEERLRLLAPFADFLETLQDNAMNLRSLTIG